MAEGVEGLDFGGGEGAVVDRILSVQLPNTVEETMHGLLTLPAIHGHRVPCAEELAEGPSFRSDVICYEAVMQGAFPQWLRTTQKRWEDIVVPITLSVFRVLFVVILLWALFRDQPSMDVPTGRVLVISWSAIAIYVAVVGVLVTRYYPRVSRATPFQILFYLVDLELHAVILVSIYAVIYKHTGLLEGNTRVTEAWDFLYFSIITWSTVGYGDIVPTRPARMLAASEAVCGTIFLGLYLAVMLHALTTYANSKIVKGE